MVKKSTTPRTKKAPVAPQKKVFYAVNDRKTDTVDQDEIWLYPTLEEAYADHINDNGTEEPCYAYKIEFLGEVSMQLTIKP
jgi:hypothetical protein